CPAPTADSDVDSLSPTTNFGGSTTLRVKSGSQIQNGYLRFDLSGVVGQIQSASLGLMANSSSSLGFSVGGVGDTTWGETTITYANAPSIGSTVNSSGAVTSGNRASVDVASLVAPAQGGLVSFGLNGSATQINLSSRESATPPPPTIVLG